jgi:hypothetical protein
MEFSINKIEYFKNGIKHELKDFNNLDVKKNILGLFNGTEQVIKLLVSEDFISDFIKNNEGIEVTFHEMTTLESKHLGKYKLIKLLIPLSGKYIGKESSPSVIIFVADQKGYFTGPLGCPDGYQFVIGLKKSLNIN